MRFVVLAIFVACASPKPSPALPCPATVAKEPDEPADGKLAYWQQVAATKDKALPSGDVPAAKVSELVAYLDSKDPERRDLIAYEVLAVWLRDHRLDAARVRELVKMLVAKMEGPLDGPIYGRSFSALVMAEVVRWDRKGGDIANGNESTGGFSLDERRAILRATHAYAWRETDLRGHIGATGWAHAAAHTGDLLAQLAQLTSLTNDDRALILDAVAGLVTRKHGHRLGHGEDSRLAPSVIVSAKLGVSAEAIAAFMAKLRAPLVEKGTPAFDPGLYHAQRNARDLLFTLYVYGSTTKEPSAGEAALFAAVKALIAE